MIPSSGGGYRSRVDIMKQVDLAFFVPDRPTPAPWPRVSTTSQIALVGIGVDNKKLRTITIFFSRIFLHGLARAGHGAHGSACGAVSTATARARSSLRSVLQRPMRSESTAYGATTAACGRRDRPSWSVRMLAAAGTPLGTMQPPNSRPQRRQLLPAAPSAAAPFALPAAAAETKLCTPK